jgi:uncharacterized protein (DUF58 family)
MATTGSTTAAPLGLTFAGGRSAEVLRRLEYLVNRRLDGLLQGDYQGLVPGHGSELGETRGYQAGDDVRRIDWNVTARMQQPHVRETIADRELESWVLLDQSPSLAFGTAEYEKQELALIALGAVGFLTARTGNRFGAVLSGRSGQPTVVPARGGRTHLLGLLRRAMPIDGRSAASRKAEPTDRVGRLGRRADAGVEPTGPTELGRGLAKLAALHQRRGLAVVISDFLAADDWPRQLGRLSGRHTVLAIEVIDPRELELPAVGVLTLVDPETGRRREVQTSSARLRARYAEAAAAQRADIAGAIRGAGADHLVLRTDRDWLSDLVRFVVLRRERATRLPRRRP